MFRQIRVYPHMQIHGLNSRRTLNAPRYHGRLNVRMRSAIRVTASRRVPPNPRPHPVHPTAGRTTFGRIMLDQIMLDRIMLGQIIDRIMLDRVTIAVQPIGKTAT